MTCTMDLWQNDKQLVPKHFKQTSIKQHEINQQKENDFGKTLLKQYITTFKRITKYPRP